MQWLSPTSSPSPPTANSNAPSPTSPTSAATASGSAAPSSKPSPTCPRTTDSKSTGKWPHKHLAQLKAVFQRHFSTNFSLKKEEEQTLLREIDELLEFFAPAPKAAEKTVAFERLQLNDERRKEVEAAVDPDELEAELAQNVSKMKEYVLNFGEFLETDDQRVERLRAVQSANAKGFQDNMGSLINFQKLSDQLGFFKLLKMGIFAVAMFAVTLAFIFLDSLLF